MRSHTLGDDDTHNVCLFMKALVKTRRAMPELVLSLSPSVAEFQCAHPRLYADVFGSEPPVPCKWSVVELEAIARCVPMRGGSRRMPPMQLQRQGSQPAFQQFMDTAFQAVQAFMCGAERLPGLPVLQSPRPRLQSALAAVGDFSMSSFRQAPPLADVRPELGVAPLPVQPPPPAVPQVQGPLPPQLESPELAPPQFKAPQLPTTKKPQAKQCAKKSVEEATSLVLSAMASKSEAKVATAVKKRPAATPPNDVNARNSKTPHFSVDHAR